MKQEQPVDRHRSPWGTLMPERHARGDGCTLTPRTSATGSNHIDGCNVVRVTTGRYRRELPTTRYPGRNRCQGRQQRSDPTRHRVSCRWHRRPTAHLTVRMAPIQAADAPLSPHKKSRPVRGQNGIFRWSGAEGTRTPDPLHAMQMRYQLRHSPNGIRL
jgi:hypothetical protein